MIQEAFCCDLVNKMSAKEGDETTDALRRRLNTAEEGTQLLMKQLEELGFSPDAKERRIRISRDSQRRNEESKPSVHMTSENTLPGKTDDNKSKIQRQLKNEQRSSVHTGYNDEREMKKQQQEIRSQQGTKQPQHSINDEEDSLHEKENQPNSSSGQIFGSKSSKHRPITPLSLRGLAIPGALQVQEPRKVEDLMPKMQRAPENEPRRRQRSEQYEERVSLEFFFFYSFIFLLVGGRRKCCLSRGE